MKLDSDKIITLTSHNKDSLKEGLLMVSNYITVVYKFFLWAHRKQFLNVNSSKNKQPLAFKHRHAAAFLLYCKAAIGGKKEKTKNPSKSRPCPKRILSGLYFARPRGRAWPRSPEGSTSGAGQAVEFIAPRVEKAPRLAPGPVCPLLLWI